MKLAKCFILTVILVGMYQPTALGANSCQSILSGSTIDGILARQDASKLSTSERNIILNSLTEAFSKNTISENTALLRSVFSSNPQLINSINLHLPPSGVAIVFLEQMNAHYGALNAKSADGTYYLSRILSSAKSDFVTFEARKNLAKEEVGRIVEILDQLSLAGDYMKLSSEQRKAISSALTETLPPGAIEREALLTTVFGKYAGFDHFLGGISLYDSPIGTTLHIITQLNAHALWSQKDSAGKYLVINLITK